MSKLHYIIVLIIVLAIATITYRLSSNIESTLSKTDPETRHDPDYFISDFYATLYDAKGAASYHLNAQQLDHFPDDDTLHMQKLNIEYFDANKQPWTATSEQGVGYQNIDVLHLSGNIIIKNTPIIPDKFIVLHTEKLRIDFVARRASTAQPVKIEGKNSIIHATGMDIDIDSGKLTLKSEARGHYVPF